MLTNKIETRTFSAMSDVMDNGEQKNVSTFSATLSANNRINFGENINNTELYRAHKEEVDNDRETWKAEVLGKILGE